MDNKQLLLKLNNLPLTVGGLFNSLNIVKSKIYGKDYQNYFNNRLLKNYESFDNIPELLNTVNRAIKTVPYYQDLYEGKEFHSLDDFQKKVKFIQKSDIMANFAKFVANDFNAKKYTEVTTGGTSGKPLKLLVPKDRHVFELSTMHSMWQTTGWNYHTRAVIRNHKLPDGKDYQINPVTKEFIFDNFRLNEEYLHKIYSIIQKNKIAYIHAYPSAAFQFACFLKDNNLDKGSIKAFFSGSENIFDYQADLIESKLGIRFYNWYGHSEKLILGGYCQHTRNYHIEPTYGYFELIDESGQPVSTPGQIGEIVGTTLQNPGMPLIRYRTGDYAEFVGNECPHCGRKLPVIKNITGRWSGEKVYNADGSFVTTTALNLHDDLYAVINGLQYIQNKIGELKVVVVKSPDFKEIHSKRLLNHFQNKFKADMQIEIKYAERLQLKENGKFLLLISSV